MSVIADRGVAVAALDSTNANHNAVRRMLRTHKSVAMLDVTRTEVIGQLAHLGYREQLMADLNRLGFRIKIMGNDLALAAMTLRETYSNKWFPIVDAAVVAFAIERDWRVVTTESRWPEIVEAQIEVVGSDALVASP